MQGDLDAVGTRAKHIRKDMSRTVRFAHNKWFVSDEEGAFRFYNSFHNGYSGNPVNRKVSINGLVMTYQESKGHLILSQYDYNVSRSVFPELGQHLVDQALARVSWASGGPSKRSGNAANEEPCSVKWSNALRLDPTVQDGICLHFTASTAGDIFVVFAAIPSNDATWYTVRIGTDTVTIFKVSF